MHYKNGRPAKNGDKIAPIKPSDSCPNLKECLHLDDVLKALPADVPDSSAAG